MDITKKESLTLTAIDVLQLWENELSASQLLNLLESPSSAVRCAVANAFQHFYMEEEAMIDSKGLAIPVLLRQLALQKLILISLRTESNSKANAAKITVSANDTDAYIDRSTDSNKSPSIHLKEEASAAICIMNALAHSRDVRPVMPLVHLLSLMNNTFVTRSIIYALGELRHSKALPALNQQVKYDKQQGNDDLVRTSQHAIARIQGREAGHRTHRLFSKAFDTDRNKNKKQKHSCRYQTLKKALAHCSEEAVIHALPTLSLHSIKQAIKEEGGRAMFAIPHHYNAATVVAIYQTLFTQQMMNQLLLILQRASGNKRQQLRVLAVLRDVSEQGSIHHNDQFNINRSKTVQSNAARLNIGQQSLLVTGLKNSALDDDLRIAYGNVLIHYQPSLVLSFANELHHATPIKP